jgi:hypothetical protein
VGRVDQAACSPPRQPERQGVTLESMYLINALKGSGTTQVWGEDGGPVQTRTAELYQVKGAKGLED